MEEGDLRVLYHCDKAGDTPQHYEAHSDGQVQFASSLSHKPKSDCQLHDFAHKLIAVKCSWAGAYACVSWSGISHARMPG